MVLLEILTNEIRPKKETLGHTDQKERDKINVIDLKMKIKWE